MIRELKRGVVFVDMFTYGKVNNLYGVIMDYKSLVTGNLIQLID